MARLRLKSGVSDRELGEIVLKMAEAAGPRRGRITKRDFERLRKRISAVVEEDDDRYLEFVFDTPRTVHIVIPYLGDDTYSDNNLANEAMGTIVVRGCGK
jgi:hypothetical protein